MSAYLADLTARLAEGIGQLPEAVRRKHLDYLLGAQRTDGGFSGREGGSDLYYTAFGLRSLSILGELYGPVAERAAEFLRSQLSRQQTVVDFFSLFYGAHLIRAAAGLDIFAAAEAGWPYRVAQFLESLRCADGGYAKAQGGSAGSTYHSFLVLLVYELLELPFPDPDRVVEFLAGQADPQGGWREIRASKRAGTNPSAAAVATLKILGRLAAVDRDPLIEFFCRMQSNEGGLCANTRIPLADLLSTFTGWLTLIDLRAGQELEPRSLRQFVDSLQLPAGGFQAFALDPGHDVEYTFYGLGCLALSQLSPDG